MINIVNVYVGVIHTLYKYTRPPIVFPMDAKSAAKVALIFDMCNILRKFFQKKCVFVVKSGSFLTFWRVSGMKRDVFGSKSSFLR